MTCAANSLRDRSPIILRALRLIVLLPAIILLADDTTPQARIKRLEDSLLAPCCYSEPVSKHRSEVAQNMKKEIAGWVAEGKSDREILDTYKRLYGPRVLIEPEGVLRWWVYTVPALAVVMGLVLTISLLRKWRSRADHAPVA